MKVVAKGPGAPRALLLPGNDLCAEFYEGLASALDARGVPTATLTLPGYHGVAPLASAGWEALVDAVAPRVPEVLVGHSMGGLLALLVAARQPVALRSLVLLEPAIFPTAVVARRAAATYLRDVVLAESERFRNWNGAQRRVADLERYPRAMIDLYEEVRRTSDRATARALFTGLPDLYPLPYRRVRVPTLLVFGSESGLLSRVMLAPLRFRLRARVAHLSGAAHWIANERDEAAAEAVSAFLRQVTPSHGPAARTP